MHFCNATDGGAARAANAIVHDAKTVEFDTCRIPSTHKNTHAAPSMARPIPVQNAMHPIPDS
jgi:hypothetical protein